MAMPFRNNAKKQEGGKRMDIVHLDTGLTHQFTRTHYPCPTSLDHTQ
jgi:hypothetical protein